MRLIYQTATLFTALLFFSCTEEGKNKSMATAEQIHQAVITIDTHDDIDVGNFTDSLNYSIKQNLRFTFQEWKKED